MIKSDDKGIYNVTKCIFHNNAFLLTYLFIKEPEKLPPLNLKASVLIVCLVVSSCSIAFQHPAHITQHLLCFHHSGLRFHPYHYTPSTAFRAPAKAATLANISQNCSGQSAAQCNCVRIYQVYEMNRVYVQYPNPKLVNIEFCC